MYTYYICARKLSLYKFTEVLRIELHLNYIYRKNLQRTEVWCEKNKSITFSFNSQRKCFL